MASPQGFQVMNFVLAGFLLPLVVLGAQETDRPARDPHRPACISARCKKIRSFVKAHYCGSPDFGNVPDDSCDIRDLKGPNSDVAVIAHPDCKWADGGQETVCQQIGQPPSEVLATLMGELRRLGLPKSEERHVYFTVWKSTSSGQFLAEADYGRKVGESFSLCEVIVTIDKNSNMDLLRGLRFQKTSADVPEVTTRELVDILDLDGDGHTEIVLHGDAYEDHWFEVYSVEKGSARMIFSGLGYYL
jgi:hypothetical protein